MDQRGQEMVMQVLLGAIMLIMVLAISYYAIGKVTANKCENEMRANLSTFADNVNQVLRSGVGFSKHVSLNIPSCYAGYPVALVLENEADPDVCKFACKTAMDKCTLLRFKTYNEKDDTWSQLTYYCLDSYLDDTGVISVTGDNLSSSSTCKLEDKSYVILDPHSSFTIRQTTVGLQIEMHTGRDYCIVESNFTTKPQ